MQLRLLVSARFLKAFGKAFLEIAGTPSIILVALYLLGLKLDPTVTDGIANAIQPFGPAIIVLFIMGVAYWDVEVN